MLPKVATHILHTTSRAAAAVHNQTHTIRNVLQLQSSSGPTSGSGTIAPWNGPGSSHWGNNGPGPGGAKHHAGSRFHGYTGAGRAVTQANIVTSHDGTLSQSDENEEFPVKRVSLHTPKRTRIRSNSLSTNGHGGIEHGENLGVLKTVQLHARSRHVFAPASSAEDALDVESLETPPTSVTESSRPALARRNSTSASLVFSDGSVSSPPSPVLTRRNSTSSVSSIDPVSSFSLDSNGISSAPPSPTDPATPQSTTPPEISRKNASDDLIRLENARYSRDEAVAAEAVRHFRATTTNPSVQEFNMAIDALNDTRKPGESLNLILETYNDMLKHSLLPDLHTYFVLINALTARDYEVQRFVNMIQQRVKRRELTGRLEVASHDTDMQRIEMLQKENNFGSAMSLFEAVLAIHGGKRCPVSIYVALIRACAYHCSIDNAIHVFAQLESRKDIRPPATVYKYMIQVYTNAGQLSGAEEIFKEYLQASKENRVEWVPRHLESAQRSHLQVWNQMIETYFRCGLPEKAVELVDQMINSKAGESFGPEDVPHTASSTFTAVLSGFCQMGDVPTALVWFDRLLQQETTTDHPFDTSVSAVRPDSVAWAVMLDALATQGMVDDLNRIFCLRLQEGTDVRIVHRIMVYTANMARIRDVDDQLAKETLAFLLRDVIAPDVSKYQRMLMVQGILDEYLLRGLYKPALDTLGEFIALHLRRLEEKENYNTYSSAGMVVHLQQLHKNVSNKIYELSQGAAPFENALELANMTRYINTSLAQEHAPFFIQSYALARNADQIDYQALSVEDWEQVLKTAVDVEMPLVEGRQALNPNVPDGAYGGIVSILEDLSMHGIAFDQLNADIVRRTVKVVSARHGMDEVQTIFEKLGPSFTSVLKDSQQAYAALEQALGGDNTSTGIHVDGTTVAPSQEMPDTGSLTVDSYLTKSIHEVISRKVPAYPTPSAQALEGYARFQAGVEKGKSPSPAAIGHLIQSLGRLGEMDKVREAYTISQSLLMTMESNKKWQAESWFMIEDSMIIALAHAGDVDSAHVHRTRILEQGGAPTADAYGALILHVKDTTDDTSNAMALFSESQLRGVAPNQYLYNNIISKLAKARKADYALELFQQMKANRIAPSSITYGAVIGACARVGDVNSAEVLFSEMVKHRNFKPRVPPYNTMMQLYTTTKPNRGRALVFYEELLRAGVKPTAHTYKLLLDTYGAIEPVDIASMEQVFQTLQNDTSVEIQGNHFASLINAYGCVQRDLEKAIAVFDSIPSYPRAQPPDAVVFEALFNALVAHRRTDLMPDYISKMSAAGVHMTAYIANFLIKGYANVGDISHAESIFESLQDPPEGVAAPNNHAPHEPGNSPAINHMEPVYREPSTWEAMIRAELGAGNRTQALELLERLKARKYPEAVYNRISGIMVDHSMVLP